MKFIAPAQSFNGCLFKPIGRHMGDKNNMGIYDTDNETVINMLINSPWFKNGTIKAMNPEELTTVTKIESKPLMTKMINPSLKIHEIPWNQLRKQAQEKGIPNYLKMNRKQLEEALI